MPHYTHLKQQGNFTYNNKIYIWVFDSETGKLRVKNNGDDLFFARPQLKSTRERITNEDVKVYLENYLKFGTPTPDISKSDPYDGMDFIPSD
jgi:hypothetical protein